MADPFLVNGNQYSWASIVCKAYEEVWTGFTGITYGDKRERVLAYGMGRHHAPRGRSHGKYTPENVKLTGWKKSVHAFLEGLAARSSDGKSYGDSEFQIMVQFVEFDEGDISVVIERCVVVGVTASHEESPDNLKEEIEIQPMWVTRNGLKLWDARQGGVP